MLAAIKPNTTAGYLTSYPTQAGAHFQAVPSYGVYAFHPSVPVVSAPANWLSACHTTSYWSTLESTNETCPTGYRRPNDGTISGYSTGAIANSEARQSLWLNPFAGDGSNTDNLAIGFYADGFFDRRLLDKQNVTNLADGVSAVSVNNSNVAFVGSIWFNPNNNASLFFPYAGERFPAPYANPEGILGAGGSYWTSSAYNTGDQWHIRSYGPLNQNNKNFAFPIRCVKP